MPLGGIQRVDEISNARVPVGPHGCGDARFGTGAAAGLGAGSLFSAGGVPRGSHLLRVNCENRIHVKMVILN